MNLWSDIESVGGDHDDPPLERDLMASLAVSAKRQADAWERVADALAVRKGESDYAAFCANEQPDGTLDSLATTANMLETWAKETFPASEEGKVHFGRAMMDSAAAEIRAFLANVEAITGPKE